jgi:carboxyl-terminal processing protease
MGGRLSSSPKGPMRRRILACIAGAVLLSPALAHAQRQPANCQTSGMNLFVRDVMTDVYYWYPSVPRVDPLRFDSPEEYLDAVRYRPLDHSFSYITSREANESFFSDSQFIGLGLSTTVSGSEMRVLQVFEGSPAAEAGLGRGHRILEINGRTIEALNASGQLDQAFGPNEIGAEVEVTFQTRDGEARRARVTKRAVTIPTVSLTRVVTVDGQRVGYVFFRNFVRPSFAALDEAFAALREAKVTELVLDLRYNGGGLVDVAVHLASLIAGPVTNGQVMAKYVHNDKYRSFDEDIRFEATDKGLGLSRLFVVTTRGSASASELLINALRPYMPVVVVGDRTYGKPVGQYGIPFCDKVVAPVAFSIRNIADQGDYFEGIPADCMAGDDITHDLGDAAEASFAEALHVLGTGVCSAKAPTAGPLRARDDAWRPTGWQSIVNAW